MDRTAERNFKEQLYEQYARVCKALGSARRLELLDLLVHGEHSVEELARESGMSVANTSQHLQNLRAAQLVNVQREGTKVKYSLAGEQVYPTLLAIRALAEDRLAEIDRIAQDFFDHRQDLQLINLAELAQLQHRGRVFLLDVRPASEFEAMHLPGAHSIPIAELPQRLDELPGQQAIVVYCRDRFSILADRAVRLLRQQGYQASRLETGLAEWAKQKQEDGRGADALLSYQSEMKKGGNEIAAS